VGTAGVSSCGICRAPPGDQRARYSRYRPGVTDRQKTQGPAVNQLLPHQKRKGIHIIKQGSIPSLPPEFFSEILVVAGAGSLLDLVVGGSIPDARHGDTMCEARGPYRRRSLEGNHRSTGLKALLNFGRDAMSNTGKEYTYF